MPSNIDGLDAIPEVRAAKLLRTRPVWLLPAILATIAVGLITLIYFGSLVDPIAHLHNLPVTIVNEDAGTTLPTGSVNFGDQVTKALTDTPAVADRLRIRVVSHATATSRLDKGEDFASIVIPRDFTRSLIALTGRLPQGSGSGAPTVQILTNQRAGSIGVSLATGVAQPALAQISHVIGGKLTPQSAATARRNPSNARELADPVTVATVTYRPLPSRSGLGLSAFYLALLTMMSGFLGATIVNSSIDTVLGYATSEVGIRWTQRLPARISRWQTLLAKWVVAAVIVPIVILVMLLVAAGILHTSTPHLAALWLFASFAAIAVALGTLVFFAALGTLGQIIALLAFIYLGLASSGGTVPIQALGPFYRFVANFEPLRQILNGIRSIVYFDAVGAAGLNRALILTGASVAFWLVAGTVVTRWFDRRGYNRIRPEILVYVNRATREHPDWEASRAHAQGSIPPSSG